MSLSLEQEQKILEAKRQYHRKWREKNKDKLKQYSINYWLRKAEQSTKAR